MSALRRILAVARYERLLLLRSTRFRVLGAVGVAVPVFVGIVLAVAESRGFQFSSALGIGAFVPFYIYSYLQAILIAFVVGDFRAADERAQVHEVLAARPLSTAELVLGKYLGAIGALGGLSLLVLLLTAAVQAAKISIIDAPFSFRPYAVYLVLMTLPALFFMTALTFLLGSLLRRQTAVSLLTITYTLAVLFFLGERYNGIYDFGAFFAPLFYSDLIGLGDIGHVVLQRLFYVALGLGFLGLAVGRYPRLPQSPASTWFGRGCALLGLAAAAGLYFHIERSTEAQQAYRDGLLAQQRAHADHPSPGVSHYAIDARILDAAPLAVKAATHLHNPHPADLDTLVFTLNPGLQIQAVHQNGGPAAWSRRGSVVLVVPASPLAPGDSTVLHWEYSGSINRQAFDLERTATRLKKSRWPFIKGDLTAWIRPESVFLPSRSRWHPVAGVDYGHGTAPPASFATADIALDLPVDLEAVTQGVPQGKTVNDGRAAQQWKVNAPVAALSLNAGRYEVYADTLGGVEYAFYVHPAHKSQALFFADAADEAREAVDQLAEALREETGLTYPFSRLSLVEVPFLIQWYYDGWAESGGLMEPGVMMIEEDVLMGHRFRRDFDRRLNASRGNEEPGQIKRSLLLGAMLEDFFGQEGDRGGVFRSPLLQLWTFERDFGGDQADLLGRGLPLYLQEDARSSMRSLLFSGRGGRFRGRRGGGRAFGQNNASGPAWDTLVVEMQQTSLADMDPTQDPELYRAVFSAKSQTFYRMVDAVLGEGGLAEGLADFGAENRHAQVSFDDFERAVVPQDKAYVKRLVHDWIHGTHVPGYSLTRAIARKVDDGWGTVVYQVIIRLKNGETGRGLVQIDVMGRGDQAVKTVEVEGGQEIEVSMILWERPFRVMVEPFLAKNRRPLVAPLRIPEKIYEGQPESYVREVAPEESVVGEVIVDNDDEGFSMPVRRASRYLRPALKGDNWEVKELPFAFGRYATNYRTKAAGDGAQPAVWETALPQAGDYDVAFYFVPPRFARRFGLRLADSFALMITHDAGTDTLRLESEALEGGWNLLGRFAYGEDATARIELSDLASGRLYADAVRWRWVDPENPEEVYEEDVATWGSFGRGRGGRGRGGRGGGAPGMFPGGGFLDSFF